MSFNNKPLLSNNNPIIKHQCNPGTSTPSKPDFKHLRWFASDGTGKNRIFTGIVFYMDPKKRSFGDRQFALSISSLM
jgi:hypothetical protein